MAPSMEKSFLSCKALEGLELDLQVVSADLRGLQNLLTHIENQLHLLEAWAQASVQATSRMEAK